MFHVSAKMVQLRGYMLVYTAASIQLFIRNRDSLDFLGLIKLDVYLPKLYHEISAGVTDLLPADA